MAALQLSLIMGANDRSRPVLDGTVQPDGIELTCTTAHPSEIFWRQLHFQEFDVSEMSLSSLLMAMAHGNRDWVGLPIFTSRRFFHTGQWVRTDSGIEKPEDLKGKRVGVLRDQGIRASPKRRPRPGQGRRLAGAVTRVVARHRATRRKRRTAQHQCLGHRHRGSRIRPRRHLQSRRRTYHRLRNRQRLRRAAGSSPNF